MKISAIAVFIIFLIHLISFRTLHPSVFWSPDEGAKFIQMKSLFIDGKQRPSIAYGGIGRDPEFQFYPANKIYPQQINDLYVRHHWPDLFPYISYPFFYAFGAAGLYIIPLICSFASILVSSFLAQKLVNKDLNMPAGILSAFFVGLASPLLFHSMLFLEHTLACALGLGTLFAFSRAVDDGSLLKKSAAIAISAACLFLLLYLRDEALIFAAALASSFIIAGFGRKERFGAIVLIFAAILCFFIGISVSTFSEELRSNEILRDIIGGIKGLINPARWMELPDHICSLLVNNPAQLGAPLSKPTVIYGFAGFLMCSLNFMLRKYLRFPCWFAGSLLVAFVSAAALFNADRYRSVHGLILPMPLIVLSWVPVRSNDADRTKIGRFIDTLLPMYIAWFAVATWLLQRPTGGHEWGLRYALLVYVVAGCSAAAAVSRIVKEMSFIKKYAGILMSLVLFAISCCYTIRGIFELQVTKRDLEAFEKELMSSDVPILTNEWWLGAALAPVFVERELFTLNPGKDQTDWLKKIGRNLDSYVFVSYISPPDVIRSSEGATAILKSRKEIQGMTFSLFNISN